MASVDIYFQRVIMNRHLLPPLLRWSWILALIAPKQALISDGLRLIPPRNQPNNPCHMSGRIDIYHNDTWGWVCDDGFGPEEAQVVCRMFGFRHGNATGSSFFGEGVGPAWLTNLNCSGNELKITDCPLMQSRRNINACSSATETAGVCCSYEVSHCGFIPPPCELLVQGETCNDDEQLDQACGQNECGASLVHVRRPTERECVANGECTNTIARFTCNCESGFVGDGDQCTDIDECASERTNNCHRNANCRNRNGSFTCRCSQGYQGDGVTCTDIDECASEGTCHQNANCRNTIGSYTCRCSQGYQGDGVTCTGIGSQPTVTSTMMAPVAQHDTGDSSPDYVLIGSVSGAGALVVIIVIIIVVICITRNKRQTREGKPVPPNGVVIAPNSGATPMTHNMSYSAPPSQDNTYIDVMPPETDDQYASLYAEPLAEGAAYTKLSGENLTPRRAMPRDVGNAEYDHIGNNGTKDHHATKDASLYGHTAGEEIIARVSGQYDQLNGETAHHKGAIRDDTYNVPDEVVKSYQNEADNQKEAEDGEPENYQEYDRTNPAFVVHEETSYDRLGHGHEMEGDIANAQDQSAQSRHDGHYDHVVMNSQGAEYTK